MSVQIVPTESDLRLDIDIFNPKESIWRWTVRKCPLCGSTDHIHGGGRWDGNPLTTAGHRVRHCHYKLKHNNDYELVPSGIVCPILHGVEKWSKKRHDKPFQIGGLEDYISTMQTKMQQYINKEIRYWDLIGRKLRQSQVHGDYSVENLR